MPRTAPAAQDMPRSGIRRLMDAAWKIDGPVLGLHVGEPSFEPPEHVLAAACAAYTGGDTHYVPNAGTKALREALSTKIRTVNNFTVTPEQLTVTAGGMQALYLALSLAVSPGDEVLIPDPGWPNYAMAVGLIGATAVRYPLAAADDFLPQPEQLDELVTERTRMILVNSPSNPVGTVMPAETIESLVRFADRHDLWLLSDECYDQLSYDAPHVSPGTYDRENRVLSAFSFSKTYAMTGVRVGYLATPEGVATTAAKLQEPLISCVNAPAQAAALAALTGPQEPVEVMRRAYAGRRDAAMAALDGHGMDYLTPHGAFYLWLDVSDRCGDSVDDWVLRLLEEQHVAVAPGTTFGPGGEGWVRLSLAADTDDLLEGIRRIHQFG